MYEMLLEISHEFEELEQLVDNNDIRTKNKFLGYAICTAIASGDPKTQMRKIVRVCQSKSVTDRIIGCVSVFSNRNLLETKEYIKFLIDAYINPIF
jgi:predicted nucleotidyltransferase